MLTYRPGNQSSYGNILPKDPQNLVTSVFSKQCQEWGLTNKAFYRKQFQTLKG